jgi:hypothetical protein
LSSYGAAKAAGDTTTAMARPANAIAQRVVNMVRFPLLAAQSSAVAII